MDGARKALIVANDEYEHDGLKQLRAPAADAVALAGVLGDAEIGAFEVQVVRNEYAHVIEGRIEDLFSDARSGDVLLLHFSCHGLKSESGELFFAARNTRPNRLGSTSVSADFVQRCMRASRARSIVLLLDCCYGGAFARGVAVRAAGDVNVLDSFTGERLGGGRGRAVITASSAMEYAFEGDQLADDHSPRPSVFTSALVEGLTTGDADRDQDGWVSLNELYDYVFDRVREQNPHQTPSRDVEMQGELYLARRSRPVTAPAALPPELQQVIDHPLAGVRAGAVQELARLLNGGHAGQALAARIALEHLADDDSRNVASAANAALTTADTTEHLAADDSRNVASAATAALATADTTEPPETGVSSPVRPEPRVDLEELPSGSGGAGGITTTPTEATSGGGGPGRWGLVRLGRGRGRWVAAGLAVLVIASVALVVLRPWSAGCRFSDGFDGSAIDGGWEEVRIGDGALKVADGSLDMSAPDGSDINEELQTAPKLLHPLTGDFKLESDLTANPLQLFQSAGVLLWNSAETYVRLERSYGDVGAIIFEYRLNGGPHTKIHSPMSTDPKVITTDKTHVVLQLTKTSASVGARWRPVEDSQWRELGTVDMKLPNTTKGGIAVLNRTGSASAYNAKFDYARATCL
ncbi:caspase domain-containing protein [Kribbella orskensis]|uniref:Caspase domain-containing protein n=2 Tax=Kribbellaceae TaxID=2726069 RepID=A0ABY2BTL2_9ACTN|nr:caspase domain-containing protein [Kribbella sp. VKM Ac-2500]TCO27882.1 caspase domain-containing protein [Kribbella orskensis]